MKRRELTKTQQVPEVQWGEVKRQSLLVPEVLLWSFAGNTRPE
jgi:hypothetical protein